MSDTVTNRESDVGGQVKRQRKSQYGTPKSRTRQHRRSISLGAAAMVATAASKLRSGLAVSSPRTRTSSREEFPATSAAPLADGFSSSQPRSRKGSIKRRFSIGVPSIPVISNKRRSSVPAVSHSPANILALKFLCGSLGDDGIPVWMHQPHALVRQVLQRSIFDDRHERVQLIARVAKQRGWRR